MGARNRTPVGDREAVRKMEAGGKQGGRER